MVDAIMQALIDKAKALGPVDVDIISQPVGDEVKVTITVTVGGKMQWLQLQAKPIIMPELLDIAEKLTVLEVREMLAEWRRVN